MTDVRLNGLLFAALAVAVAVICGALSSAASAAKYIDQVVGATGGQGGQFNAPKGIATNDATADGNGVDGWFYVADDNNHRIQAFNAAGVFQWAIGRNVSAGITTGDDSGAPGFAYEKCVSTSDCQGGTGSGAVGGFTGGRAGMFDNPQGVAVNQATGHVYVRDRDNRRVQEFTADGDFVRMWGWDVINGAVPNDNGTAFEICDVTNGNSITDCQQGSPGGGVGQFASGPAATGIAVQQSTGDVIVVDPGNRRFQKFESNGDTPTAIGSSTIFPGTDSFADSDHPIQVAISDSGMAYLWNNIGPGGGNRVERYDLNTSTFLTPLIIDNQAFTVGTGLAISATGNLLVLSDGAVSEYCSPETTPVFCGTLMSSFAGSIGGPSGFAHDRTTGDFFFSATGNGHRVYMADDDGAPPAGVTLLPATEVGATGATLHAELTSPDALTTNYRLEVSRNGSEWATAGTGTVPASTVDLPVSATASGLQPNTLYRFRVVTARQFGNPDVVSAELTFLTDAIKPEIADVRATAIQDTSVTLQGRVNPYGTPTVYRFEYGVGSYNRTIPAVDGTVGAGPEFVFVSEQLSGLASSTTYQYRLVATSASEGTTVKDGGTFVTAASAPPSGARAYELVSPADKIGGVGVGRWGGGAGGAAAGSGVPAHVGERFASQGDIGSVLVDGAIAGATDWAFAERTPSGWVNHSPITHPSTTRQSYRFFLMKGASSDLSKVTWTSNFALLTPFPQLAGWPDLSAEFVGDWAGRWELVAPTSLDQMHTFAKAEGQADRLARSVVSSDGSAVGFTTGLPQSLQTQKSVPGGVAGDGDPTHPRWTDLIAGRSVYVDDVSAGLSDAFEGNGVYSNVGVCAGGTETPAQNGAGLLVADECASPTERQRLTVDATGGSFVLQFGAATTGAIAYNAPASGAGSLQAALEALPNLAPDDLTVTGGPGGAGGTVPYVVRFAAGLGDVPELVVDQSALAGAGANATVDSFRVDTLISSYGAALHPENDQESTAQNIVSADGSRVVFMSPDPVAGVVSSVPAAGCTGTGTATQCPVQLYVRQQNEDGSVSTRWISRAEDGLFGNQSADLTGTVRFAGASENGDKVYFQTNSPLTDDDPNGTGAPVPGGVVSGAPSGSSWDLYVYDLPDGPDGNPSTPDADPAGGTLTRVSRGPDGSGDCNVVLDPQDNALRFASDDGGRAYFTCSAPLPGVSDPTNGTITTPGGSTSTVGTTNLYAYANTGGAPSWDFVAQLPRPGASTNSSLTTINGCATTESNEATGLLAHSSGAVIEPLRLRNGPGSHCVRGTADGAFLTFWTAGRLTVDDPDATTVDAYGYDAEAMTLTRITAPQGGAGDSYICNPLSVDPEFGAGEPPAIQCNGDDGFGGEALELLGVATKPLTEGDRIAFFQTRSRLVAADVDNAYDVYEWRNGKLSLISTGSSAYDGGPGEIGGAFYKGNDETGRNVYLATNDKLTWQDTDAVLDIYTARLGGGIAQPDVPVICGVLSGGCRGQDAGTVSPSPRTDSVRGDGDAKPGVRARVTVAAPGARARRRAARTGVLSLRVRTASAGRVSVVVRGKLDARMQVLGTTRKRVGEPGVARVDVRLNAAAREALERGRALRLRVAVSQPGARERSIAVRLHRGPRS